MCDVCCEKFTYHNKKVNCQFCDFSACRECHKTYVFGTNNEFHCMSCRKEWTDDYVATNFTKKMYNNELRIHRENIIVDKEKAFLPHTQECLGRYKKYKEYELFIEKCRRNRKKLLDQHVNNEKISWKRYNEVTSDIQRAPRRKQELKLWVVDKKYETQKVMWTWPCPESTCKGFLEGNTGTCGICKRQFCKECNEEHQCDHVCDKETKETFKLIKKDCKPCPKCSSVIYKIDGCDQMWCPDCKTAFSWTKGTIETKIHNPHYYEYLRTTKGHVPREPGDQCDMPDYPRLMLKESDHGNLPTYITLFRIILYACNTVNDNWSTDVINEYIGDHELKFLRCRYMANDLTYDKWKWNLQKRYKAVRKCNEINQIFNTLYQVATDLFWNETSELDDIIEQTVELLRFINNSFGKISKRFKCIVPQFDIGEDHHVDCILTNVSNLK